MNYIPEDLAILCELVIDLYGKDYITDWQIMTDLINTEFDIVVSPTILQSIHLDMLEYLDISKTLNNCGINY